MSYELSGDGRCVSMDDALEMFECYVPDALSSNGEVDPDEYEYALNRFRFMAQRMIPVKPRFNKGKYGHKYDSYSCGKCGAVVTVSSKYCSQCGRPIKW